MHDSPTADLVTSHASTQRAVAWTGIIGPVLFTATFLSLALARLSGYDRVVKTVIARRTVTLWSRRAGAS